MIPILYEKGETAFASNGLGRLRDCIDCTVVEERNSVYYCDFSYPVDGVNYDRIQLGRIIAVEHDETNDVQPFDIVSYSRPIDGVVTFHAVHISYRQTALAVSGSNINSLADAFTLFGNATPSNPFSYWTDKDGQGFMASADGVPHSVRTMLGGMEGSVLDAYGGEYEWDRWMVKLWASRGELKNFTIRYGVNLVDYEEELDYSDTYNAVVPFWKGQGSNGNDITVTGDMVEVSYPTFNGTTRCIPLDVTDKFEIQPTKAQVEAQGLAYINANQTYLPAQTIKVDFVRITESGEYQQFANLQKCKLCDTIRVIFSRYNMEGTFKIVRTEYDVLQERYSVMELGTLSTTLSEALGINQESANRLTTDDVDDYVVDVGTDGIWTYRKWNSGVAECWLRYPASNPVSNGWGTGYLSPVMHFNFISNFFTNTPTITASADGAYSASVVNSTGTTKDVFYCQLFRPSQLTTAQTFNISVYAIGTWK